jgi:2-oxo-4-hydroxy-4-carboxy-5-ureidoimidazoline decarboxylase
MTFDELNSLDKESAIAEFLKCCGSTRWALALAEKRPFADLSSLLKVSDQIWEGCSGDDALEAFGRHPKIGDLENLEKKFASTKDWAGGEQSGVNTASNHVLQELAEGNERYEQKFGYIFIVCASGKSAKEMLDLLTERLWNDAGEELEIAMKEQNKIAHLRFEKLLA